MATASAAVSTSSYFFPSLAGSFIPPFRPRRFHHLPFPFSSLALFPCLRLYSSPLLNPSCSSLRHRHIDDDDEEEDGAEPPIFDHPYTTLAEDMPDASWPRSSSSTDLAVPDLEDLPEQWRRSRIAWLCKTLPNYKHSTFTRLLNSNRKWMSLSDATYVTVHLLRIREFDAAFRVYTWMAKQEWWRFDLALAGKLADGLGRDRKVSKCREVFDGIVQQGHVPPESTYHILIVAYLSAAAAVDGAVDEACEVYNQMIHRGGYSPRLSLHNALFRALVGRTGGAAKHYLRQAEFIFQNISAGGHGVRREIYAGLIWLHSYQEADVVDLPRIAELSREMSRAGHEEDSDVLVSIMRAFSKVGNIEETERAYSRLLGFDPSAVPPQAVVCRIELYAVVGNPVRSLEIFREMKAPNVAAYHKIIQIMARAREVDAAESLMAEFAATDMKHLMPAFLDLMYMYFDLGMDDQVASTFRRCTASCRLNRPACAVYLESLVRAGKISEAEELFDEMRTDVNIGITAKSCNVLLAGFLAASEHAKAEKLAGMMRAKRYDIEPTSFTKLRQLTALRPAVFAPLTVNARLEPEQREILIGLLLGGVKVEAGKEGRSYAVHFEIPVSSGQLRLDIGHRFSEWLDPSSEQMSTIFHPSFAFFAGQFRPAGRPAVPKLIHRWMSPRVLAYWYMYAGMRLPSGDVVLKLAGATSWEDDVTRVVEAIRAMSSSPSFSCRVRRKRVGRSAWIGFRTGEEADGFWELVRDHVLQEFCVGAGENNPVSSLPPESDYSDEGQKTEMFIMT